jgi:hypothetical protein
VWIVLLVCNGTENLVTWKVDKMSDGNLILVARIIQGTKEGFWEAGSSGG